MAAAMSTRCITWPPSSLPSWLVVAGSTTSAISEREALTALGFHAAPGAVRFLVMAVRSCAGRDFGRRRSAVILPAADGRPKEKPQAGARGVRGQQARGRLFPLRAGARVPERRRPGGSGDPLPGAAGAKRGLRPGLPDVCADAGAGVATRRGP